VTLFPVIARELAAQARQPFTYWLRVIGAGGLALAFGLTAVSYTPGSWAWQNPGRALGMGSVALFGAELFGNINATIFTVLWLLVPLLSADAISRERREGTLGLLFLTPLRAAEVVLGKSLVHVLRAVTLLVTMSPWLMLPVLFGGVELKDVKLALLFDSSILLLALTAGLLASCWPKDWIKTVLVAEVLSLLLGAVFLEVENRGFMRILATAPTSSAAAAAQTWGRPIEWQFRGWLPGWEAGGFTHLASVHAFVTNNGQQWRMFWTNNTPAGHAAWLAWASWLLLGAALVLAAGIGVASWRVARSWQDAPRSLRAEQVRQHWLGQRFWRSTLRRRLRSSLDRNPVGWLQLRSPQARLAKWGWCLLVLVVETALSCSLDDLTEFQHWLGLLLMAGLAFSAAGSFRAERESGAIELLLVSPLRIRAVILGRARGLWMQFLPGLVLFAAANAYVSSWSEHYRTTDWPAALFLLAVFASLPFIGLYFSMQRLNPLVAWLWTCGLGILLPWGMQAVPPFFDLYPDRTVVLLLPLVLGGMAWGLLHRSLRARSFALR
jgi:ABC-type transport system involved in cytochrome c biogenesis permease component